MIAPLPKVACTSGIPIKPALKKLLEKVATPSFFQKREFLSTLRQLKQLKIVKLIVVKLSLFLVFL